MVKNPAHTAKRALLGDLLALSDDAALDVQTPNGAALANSTIDKAPIADLLAARDMAITNGEQAVHDGILALAAAALTELRALPLMVEEAPPAPPPENPPL